MEQPISTENIDLKNRVLSLVHAILILPCAYLLIYTLYGVFEHNGYPLIFLVAVCVLFGLTLLFGLLSGGKLNAHAIASLVFGLVSGLNMYLNGLVTLSGYLYLHVLAFAYTFFALSIFSNHNRTFGGGVLILDLIKATLLYPFASFAALFTAIFSRSKGDKKAGHAVLFTLLGVVLALVLGGIAVALLSYDETFKALFTIDWEWENLPEILLRLLFTVPLAALLFGAFASSKAHKLANMSTPETAHTIGSRMQKVPPVVLLLPSFVLLIIYGLFFFTQWETYMSAFIGILPDAYTAAEYARSGFFELCAVAAINAGLTIVTSLFMKQGNEVAVVFKKVVNTLLAVATLILIATALSKMLLYIKRFDLTVLRLSVSVTLVLIAIGYVASLLSQWIKKVRVLPVLLVCVSTLLLILPFINVRGQIAKYNVDAHIARYESHTLGDIVDQIDVAYLIDDLGSAGVVEAIRLYKSGTLTVSQKDAIEWRLEDCYKDLKVRPASELSAADRRALAALSVWMAK